MISPQCSYRKIYRDHYISNWKKTIFFLDLSLSVFGHTIFTVNLVQVILCTVYNNFLPFNVKLDAIIVELNSLGELFGVRYIKYNISG